MDTPTIKKLADALAAWLSFQTLCGRSTLLSEDYLAQPLAEFLTPLFPNRITAEWTSPQFKLKARGRPRQIDYTLHSRDDNHPVTAIEAKWVCETPPQKQRFIDDVMRLEAIRLENASGKVRHTQKLFLLCGLVSQTNRFFDSCVRDEGDHQFFPMFLPATDFAQHTVSVKSGHKAIRPYFKDFATAYKVQLPTSYYTQRLAHVQNEHAVVSVWEIQSIRKRKIFDPSTVWPDVQIVDEVEESPNDLAAIQ